MENSNKLSLFVHVYSSVLFTEYSSISVYNNIYSLQNIPAKLVDKDYYQNPRQCHIRQHLTRTTNSALWTT